MAPGVDEGALVGLQDWVLEREFKRVPGVIDHMLLECEPADAHGLTAALSTESGFVVLGLRRSSRTRGSAAELDFLLALADNTHLGVDLFTDAIPRIFAADWAIAYRIEPNEIIAQTALAPSVDPVTEDAATAAGHGEQRRGERTRPQSRCVECRAL